MLPSISSSISLVSDATATSSVSGPAAPLGSTYIIPASDSDRGLVVLNSDNTVFGDARADVPSGGELVSLAGGEGELELIYIKNATGSTISRGQPVMVGAAAAPYSVTQGVATAVDEPTTAILGIALFDIPTAKAAWVVKRGVVKGLGGDTSAAGTALMVNSDGEFIAATVTPVTGDSGRVIALETLADATLKKVFINA
jgi:hypothetical protein